MPDWITLSKFLPQLVYPFSLALLLLLLAWAWVLLGKRWKGSIAIGLALAILMITASPLSQAVYRQHEQKFPAVPIAQSPNAGAIVVLGGDVGIPNAPRTTSQLDGNRLFHAFRLYKAAKAPVIVITGGNVFPQEGLQSEAMYSKAILEEIGVASDAILTETDSRNTYQNAVNTRKMLGEIGIDRIILVTDAFHMPRAVAVFEKAGFEVIPSPSGFSVVDFARPKLLEWWPSLGNLSKAHAVMREKLGLIVYQLRGWAA